jgi:hypothetical protein
MVTSSDQRYKIVAIPDQGWYFYSPPINNPDRELFISTDDPLAFQVAEMLNIKVERATRSHLAAKILLQKLINLEKVKINKGRRHELTALI